MRIAVLNDIHGNLPALEAVMREVRRERVDQIVAGGDVVVGPMSREVLEALLALDIPVRFVYGNCEVAVLQQMDGNMPAKVPEPYRGQIAWTAEQLQPHRATLDAWPKTLTITIGALGETLFCHATPRNEDEIVTQDTPEQLVQLVLQGVAARAVVCGHTHMQYDRAIGSTRMINAGSVGMPFGDAGADWLLLGPDVELRHTNYDLSAAAARIRDTGYPLVEDWIARYLLNPPSAAEMLKAFTPAQVTA